METYKIVRHYFRNCRKRTIQTGLTLKEAQKWCSDPETSSRTAMGAAAKRVTKRNGEWFDGYTKE